ncbi:hypothetical protein ABTY98_19750 [Streptomyces sp. NPDC096040]|uniref:hypothetical protein n=1 Tax=Streptomyces sp. NPDC096040 TaxID=3155541 RepID=UPI00332E7F7C
MGASAAARGDTIRSTAPLTAAEATVPAGADRAAEAEVSVIDPVDEATGRQLAVPVVRAVR